MTNRKKKPFWVKFLSTALVVSMLIGSVGMSSFAAPDSADESTNVEETVSNDESTDGDSEQSGTEGTGGGGTGTEGTGAEGAGTEGTGAGGTGTEGTGAGGTGAEGTGAEGAGTEGTGAEGTGTEGTGTEEPGTASEANEAEKEKLPVAEEVKAFLDAVDALPDSITTAEEYDTVKAAMENILSQYAALAEEAKNSDNVKTAKLKIDKLQEELKNGRPEEVTDENAALTEFRALLDQMEAFELTEDNTEEFCEMGYRLRELADVLFEGDYEGMEDDMARYQALCEKLSLLTEVNEKIQAFLDAVEKLPGLDEVTRENLEEVKKLVAACEEAYNALGDEDREDAAVVAAYEKMTALKEKIAELEALGDFTATFDEETGTLTINGTGTLTREAVDSFEFDMVDPGHNNGQPVKWALNGYSATSIYKQPRHLNSKVKHLVIGDGITAIEDMAFGGDTNPNASVNGGGRAHYRLMPYVETVVLPEGLTDIGANAFQAIGRDSGGELQINFPSTLKTIGSKAFYDCKTLPKEFVLSIPDVVIEESAFNNCEFTSITVDGAKEIGEGAFGHSCITNIYTGEKTGGGKTTTVTLANIGTIGRAVFDGQLQLTELTMTNVDEIAKLAFWGMTSLETVSLKNVKNIGEQAFYGWDSPNYIHLKKLAIDGCESIGKQAFIYCNNLTDVTLNNVGTIGEQAFQQAFNQETVLKMDNIGTIGQRAFYYSYVKNIQMGKVDTIAIYAFDHSPYLASINSLADVGRIDGFAFYGCSNLSGLTVADMTKMGFNGNYGDIMNRVRAILSGAFKLDSAPGITDITTGIPEEGWDDGKWGKSDNWNTYNNGTQLVEQARWTNDNRTEAEVKVDAYYTAPKQMDYIFVADLSASMAQLGNDADMNSRFYDMQSKLLDVTNELLTAGAVYDCRVAIVTFGGALSDTTPGTYKVMDFTRDAGTVQNHINSLEPLYENTDYGLGMQQAQRLVAGNNGRDTVVIFLSDGAPNRNGSGDMNGTNAAAAIKAAGVDIYGVLHSPGAGHDGALAKMQAVCGGNTVFESTDTQSFGKAMNDAFTAVYPDYTVTIPVNSAFENVRGLSVSATAGSASYDAGSHTITWTITGMPFTKHTLRYNMSLTTENAALTGERTFDVNDGSASIAGGAVVETPQLSRTVGTGGSTPDPTPTPDPGGGGGTPDPTPTPPTPEVTPIIPGPVPTVGPTPVVPIVTPVAATPTAALVSPTPEAVALADEAVPLAAEEEKQPEIEAVDEEGTPLAGGRGAAWALINFALMNLAIFESVMLLIGYFVKTKNDEEEEKRKLKKKGIFRIISLPIAIISLIVFILTEDITLPTAFVDKYTIVMLIIAIVQTVMVALSNKKYEDEEEEEA